LFSVYIPWKTNLVLYLRGKKRIWLLWYQLANSGKLKKAGKRTKTLVPFDDAWWKWKPCMID
jgi:hypothetical protein